MAHLSTRCCIAGGGPAGLMLGLLLARAGVEVVVLEKHADFLRDFRGDTIHPSTLEVMHELGFLDDLLQLPYQKVARVDAQFGETVLPFADLSHLPTQCKFIALMPQWDFLSFLADRAARHPTFKLVMSAEVTDLLMEGGRCVGVRAETADGPLDVRAELVVGADGRQSIGARRRRVACRRIGRTDGRAVVSPVPPGQRSGGDRRPLRRGPAVRHAQPHRLLAMRLCHSQGHRRAGSPRPPR
jgi:2-polyprenyl-6-methoxyphenol hydroxylase-like FAD-dependent oxidoreductase